MNHNISDDLGEQVQNVPHCTRIEDDDNGRSEGGFIKPGAGK